jgi:3-methyladenine DNA glycosylase AlkD
MSRTDLVAAPSRALPLGALLRRVRRELRRVADPARAPMMQAYMKSVMPYHGVPTPVLRRTCKPLLAGVDLSTAEAWRESVLELWRGAKYREERYVAILLTGARHAAPYQVPGALPMYEELIVTGAWWDYVDEVAIRRIGPILRDYPVPLRKRMLAWSVSPNLWKRRTSIICQVGFKEATDLDLLYACIEPSLASKEFFLRKAIGWALRQHAWTDPAEVRRYVRRNRDRLSGLSVREAMKNIAE